MRIVNPSATLLDPKGMHPYEIIERIGRTCYKSEDLITPESNIKFVQKMRENRHFAMLEHSNIIFKMGNVFYSQFSASINDISKQLGRRIDKYIRVSHIDGAYMTVVSGSFRAWIELLELLNEQSTGKFLLQILSAKYPELFSENGSATWASGAEIIDESELKEFVKGAPNESNILKTHIIHTVKFVCDRGVTHEFVRHRPASFAQESTRYCNYSKGKFGEEITVVKPCFYEEGTEEYELWKEGCEHDEKVYLKLLSLKRTPQEARDNLPTSVKTELFITANEEEWQHIINLRYIGATGAPHPQMKECMTLIVDDLIAASDGRLTTLKTVKAADDVKKSTETVKTENEECGCKCKCHVPLQLEIKKLTDTAIVPTRGSAGAAGYDLYADSVQGEFSKSIGENGETIIIAAGGANCEVHTGIAMAIPHGYVGLLFARSGLSTKKGLRPANCVGVIDEDYRGEVILKLHNDIDFSTLYANEIAEAEKYIKEHDNLTLSEGYDKLKEIFPTKNTFVENFSEFALHDRVAQIVFVKYEKFELKVLGADEELSSTDRGTNGFGSTGTK